MFSIQLTFTFERLINNLKFINYKQSQKAIFLEENDLQRVWNELKEQYFPNEESLNCYQIKWSDRKQKRCLASCNSHTKKVLVARALANQKYAEILSPLIYHEMCHAVLGTPQIVNGRRSFHGKEFKLLEKRHPGIKQLNLWIKNGGWANAKRSYTQLLRRSKLS